MKVMTEKVDDKDCDTLVYNNGKRYDGNTVNNQWMGWKEEFPANAWFRMSTNIKFAGSVPPPTWMFGLQMDGVVYNDWLKTCKADEWCWISAEGPSTENNIGNNLFQVIFDTLGGPRDVYLRNTKLEVYTTKEYL